MITNPNAKRVLVFGDSLSWGYIPGSGHERFPANVRWPGRLQDILGDSYEVIEEALNSRAITNIDNRPGKEGRRALDYIIPCLDSHDPLDWLVLQLGTNELKHEYGNTPEAIGDQIREIAQIVANRPSQFRQEKPRLILLSPPSVDETTDYASKDGKYLGASAKAAELPRIYDSVAKELGAVCVHLTDIPVGADGVHFDASSNSEAAKLVAQVIQS